MTWREPQRLEKVSASAIALRILDSTEKTLTRCLTVSGQEGGELVRTLPIESERCRQIKEFFSKLKQWWNSIPGIKSNIGSSLECAISYHCERPPKNDNEILSYVAKILLKLSFLREPFIDRDYGDTVGTCLIPSKLELVVKTLVQVIGPYRAEKLSIYGGLYPSIVEGILKNCPRLKKIAISYINITSDLLIFIGRYCPDIQGLYLMHPYIWNSVSKDAFLQTFFPKDFEKYRYTPVFATVPFPHLKELEIAFTDSNFMVQLHKNLLAKYKTLENICIPWKTSVFEDGFDEYTDKVIFPLIHEERIIYLNSLFLTGDILLKMKDRCLRSIIFSMHRLKKLYIDCNIYKRSSANAGLVGQRLRLVGCEKKVGDIYANVSTRDHATTITLTPLLELVGTNLTSLTLESKDVKEILQITTLFELLSLTPNLQTLKLFMWNRFLLVYPEKEDNSVELPSLKNLKELWLHEGGPWGSCPDDSQHTEKTKKWINLLQSFLDGCPKISQLSLTLCRSLTSIIDILQSNISSLHLHMKDGCEFNVKPNVLISLILRQQNLRYLYLEEFDCEVFWSVQDYFKNSELAIKWGNLYGWPRS